MSNGHVNNAVLSAGVAGAAFAAAETMTCGASCGTAGCYAATVAVAAVEWYAEEHAENAAKHVYLAAREEFYDSD